MIKVIVAGSRDFDSYELLKDKFIEFSEHLYSNFEIVSGRARGADMLGEKLARELAFKIAPFPADWKRQPDGKYDKSAGHVRNAQMADYGDVLLAFWDGESRGTKGMIDLATRKGLLVIIHTYSYMYFFENSQFYKQLCVDGELYGEKVEIESDEYLGGN